MTFEESVEYFNQNVLPTIPEAQGITPHSDAYNNLYNQWAHGIEEAYFGQAESIDRFLTLPIEALSRPPPAESESVAALRQQHAAAQQNGYTGDFLDWVEQRVIEDPSILQDRDLASFVEGFTGSQFQRDTSGNIILTAPEQNIEDFLGGAASNLASSIVNQIPGQIAADQELLGQYAGSFQSARDAITDRQAMGTLDPELYLRLNPDVAQWAQESVAAGAYPNLAAAAQAHYETNGIREGRNGTPETSRTFADEMTGLNRLTDTNRQIIEGQTAQDIRDFATAESEQNAALGQQVAERSASLSTALSELSTTLEGELGQRAQALAQLASELTNNFNAYSQAERAALAQQLEEQYSLLEQAVAERQAALETQVGQIDAALQQEYSTRRASLEQEISELDATIGQEFESRRASLEQQLAALGTATDAQSAAERAALQQQLSSLGAAFNDQVGARRAALQQELSSLESAYQQEATAARGALGVELDKLLTAQQPLNNAREQAALTRMAAINLGANEELARVEAENALAGFVGDSTSNQRARQRALIGARQEAAGVLGDARTTNASDIARIQQQAATQERLTEERIARDALQNQIRAAGETRGLDDFESAGRYNLAEFGAGQTRQQDMIDAQRQFDLAALSADQTRILSDAEAAALRELGVYSAQAGRALTDEEAAAVRELATYAATEGRSLATTAANERFGIGNTGAIAGRDLSSRLAQGDLNLQNQLSGASYDETLYGVGSRADLERLGTDQRLNLANFATDQGRAITDAGTTNRLNTYLDRNAQVQSNAQAGEANRFNFYLQDLNRQVSAASDLPNLINTEFAIRDLPNNRALNNLNRAIGSVMQFSSNAGGAPTVQPILNNYDSGQGALAGSLINFGLNQGQTGLTNYFQSRPPKVNTTPQTTPKVNTTPQPADPSSPFN